MASENEKMFCAVWAYFLLSFTKEVLNYNFNFFGDTLGFVEVTTEIVTNSTPKKSMQVNKLRQSQRVWCESLKSLQNWDYPSLFATKEKS